MQYRSLRSGEVSKSSHSPNKSFNNRFYSSLTRGRRASRWEKIPANISNGEYVVFSNQPLGKGSFGVIYDGFYPKVGISVAIKFEAMGQPDPQLTSEAKIYRKLWSEGVIGIPKIFYWGVESNYTVLVIEKLGPSLEELFTFCGKEFSLKTVLMLADQMISRFNLDVKPENFVMGVGPKGHHVYILDFGLAKKYRVDKKHIRKSVFESLTGTVRYTSINSHNGITQSRRDDLESLGYIFVYFLKGGLPWQGLPARTKRKKYNKIRKKKIETSLNSLCKGLPSCFMRYFKYVRNLKFDATPDYNHLRRIFQKEFIKREYVFDFEYDWNLRRMDLYTNDRVHVYVSDIGKEEEKTNSIPSPRNNYGLSPRNNYGLSKKNKNERNKNGNLLTVPDKGFVRIEDKVGSGNPGSNSGNVYPRNRKKRRRRSLKKSSSPKKKKVIKEKEEEETEGEETEEESSGTGSISCSEEEEEEEEILIVDSSDEDKR